MMKTKLFLIFASIILLMSVVSCAEFDNTMSIKKSTKTQYPILEFKNNFGTDKIADVEILENTDQCLIDCYTLGTITLYKEDKIFDQFEFVDKKNVKKNLDYKFLIEIEQDYTEEQAVLDEVCGINENLTTSCHYVQVDTITVPKTRKVWQEYDGKKLPIGIYRWRLEATKDKGEQIDWAFTYQGVGFEEVRKHYVWWNGSWDVKAEIKIEERSGSTINNYTADITIPYNSLMRTDYQDLRFLNQSETGELGYWMYFSNASEARFRVRIPYNLLPKQNNTIWMYYENPTATTTSSIVNAHIIGEDGADFTEWTEQDAAGRINLNTVTRRVEFTNLPRLAGYIVERQIPPFENYSFSFVSSITAIAGGYAIVGLSNSTENPITLNGLKGTSYTAVWRDTLFNLYGYGGTTAFFNDFSAGYALSSVYHTKVTRNGNVFNATTYSNAYVTSIMRYGGITTGISKNINVSIMLTSYDEAGSTISGYLTNYTVFKYIYPEPLISIQGSIYQNLSIDTGQTYNLTTYETQHEGFLLNLSYNSSAFSSISATLIYNGTSYIGTKTGSGDNLIFTRSIDVPLISSATNSINLSFYWSILLTNASGVNYWNMTVRNQTVSKLVFTRCNVTYSTPILVNYSIFDEETLLPTNATFESTFYYNIAGSSIYKNYSYASPNDDNSSYHFCSNVNTTFNVDAIIRLDYAGYNERTYWLNNEQYFWSNRSLYLLPENNGTRVLLDLRDVGMLPLAGYYIKIDRYYPSTNTYLTVSEIETDGLGQAVVRLIEDVVTYKFKIYNPSGTLVHTESKLYIPCTSAAVCTVKITVPDAEDDFSRYLNLTGLANDLDFITATNTFTASWTDIRGESASYRLEVVRFRLNESVQICNSTSLLQTGTINCYIGNATGTYTAQFYRTVGGKERRIDYKNVTIGEKYKTFMKEGLLWAFLLLFTLMGIGSFNPSVGAGLYLVGVIVMGVLGLISLNIPIFFANLVIVVAFIWAFRG